MCFSKVPITYFKKKSLKMLSNAATESSKVSLLKQKAHVSKKKLASRYPYTSKLELTSKKVEIK